MTGSGENVISLPPVRPVLAKSWSYNAFQRIWIAIFNV